MGRLEADAPIIVDVKYETTAPWLPCVMRLDYDLPTGRSVTGWHYFNGPLHGSGGLLRCSFAPTRIGCNVRAGSVADRAVPATLPPFQTSMLLTIGNRSATSAQGADLRLAADQSRKLLTERARVRARAVGTLPYGTVAKAG